MHGHNEKHHNHHHHNVAEPANTGAFIAGIILNLIYVIVQVVMGVFSHSMAMLADAGHNLGDVMSLGLSLLAINWANKKSTKAFTYGYKKTTILAALTNAVVLLVTIGVLGFESIKRLLHPQVVDGGWVAIVATLGILINFGSAMFFFKEKEHDINTKSAFLHLFTDGMVSLAVVISGILISITQWYWLDGAISLVVLGVILFGTWNLLVASLRMSIDGVPKNIDTETIKNVVLSVPGVESIHHLHIWAMSTTENALTTHVIIAERLTFLEKIDVINEIKHELYHNKIHHATIEMESREKRCKDKNC